MLLLTVITRASSSGDAPAGSMAGVPDGGK